MIERIATMMSSWSLGPWEEALRGLGGIDLHSAATFVATAGHLDRFAAPCMVMGYLELSPSEHSSGGNIRRGGFHQDRQQRG
jgi:transposase